jgi:hypothetical protein
MPHVGRESALGRVVGVVLGERQSCIEETTLTAMGWDGAWKVKKQNKCD